MKAPCEQDIPPDLADHVDSALEALWRGNSGPFERLLDSDEVAPLPIGELLEDVAAEQAKPIVGLSGESEIAGYEVISEIGRGGMGVVYEALQTSTKRTVALKVMLAGRFASRAGRRRFQREVELTARLQHPGIVRVLESGETSTGQPYYAMDYVRGVPLAEWLGAEQPDVRATLGLFIELCEAVHDAHRHGVIHRDLKPGNVLVDAEGRPHILDFGLAKAMDRAPADENLTGYVSLPGQVLGTLRYLSPEQAAGTSEQIDERTDVYALGVMLFEALTGSLPYDPTGRPSDVARRILEEPAAFPSAVSNRVDDELETIILKALDKEKARRYQSAQKMGEDLRRYLVGEPVLAKRPSTVYALRKKLARHRAGFLLALAVVVAGAGALGTAIWARHDRVAKARSRALGCQRGLEKGGPSHALGCASAVYDRYPHVPEVRLLWAQTEFRLGLQVADEYRCGTAIRILKEGLEDDSSSWLYGALLAEILRRRQDPEWKEWQARADRDAPDTSEAWYLRSFATLEIEEARRCAEEALEGDPGHILARERLAHLYLQTEDYDAALKTARDATGREGKGQKWAEFQGHVLTKRGDYAEAIEEFTRVIQADPGNLNAHRHRALAYLCLGEYDEAIADYSTCLEFKQAELDASWDRYYRATPLWITGRRKEAADDYRRFHSLRWRVSYGDARLFFVLHEEARTLDAEDRTGEAEQFRQDARAVLDTGRREAVPRSWLDQIFSCLAGELSADELVAAADPQNLEYVCESYYYAGEVSLLIGQIDEARKWFQKCVDHGLMFDPSFTHPVVMSEYHLARWRLESLAPDSLTGSQPERE